MPHHDTQYLKPVLDHGFVRMIDFMGNDLSVVRAARVSYDSHWRAGEDEGSDEKLIRYLWNHRHTTPFEAVTFTFEVKAPIFVFRQWHRHRTFSYNELSARYKELPKEYYIPELKHIGVQSSNNKQGRAEANDAALMDRRKQQQVRFKSHCEKSFMFYKELLDDKWPRELARAVLPVNTYSHMFCTVNLLNLLKFINLRSDPHAQYEIRVYSDAMMELAKNIVPVCMKIYEESGQSNR